MQPTNHCQSFVYKILTPLIQNFNFTMETMELSDSESDQTIIMDNDELKSIFDKYGEASSSEQPKKQIYNLEEFPEFECAPSYSNWKGSFSLEDFCENSNDLDQVLLKINELESNNIQSKRSEDFQNLITDDLDISFKDYLNNRKFVPTFAELSEPEVTKSKTAQKSNSQLERQRSKAEERELKKQEKEQQKYLKNALKIVENSSKPDQCSQYITVNLDNNLCEKPYGEVIIKHLQCSGYNFKRLNHVVPNLITWERKLPKLKNMILENEYQKEKHKLLVLDVSAFLEKLEDSSLVVFVQSILSLPDTEHLSIALMELDKYYHQLKQKRNKEQITKYEIEKHLVELQIFCKNIYIRPINKFEDLAAFVGECSKAVAQLPHKLEKSKSMELDNEYFAASNRDCVRVDKDGNGLNQLWAQFIRMFPLASLETAEAIIAVYPTIKSLMDAYKRCQSVDEGEKLLQDLPVRRAAGPLESQRRLGPEFSKKAYKFFCSMTDMPL